MAFPGTYNINYYKGDTLEFRVYPKDSNGNVFPLAQYVSPNGITKFTIAPSRGAVSGSIQGYAVIDNDNTHILCAITPQNGAALTAGIEYVYDIEISRSDANYDYVYTLLTGTITVSEQVTQPGETQVPDNPTDLVIEAITTNSITASWTPALTGGTVESYKLFILPYTIDSATIALAFLAGPVATVAGNVTEHEFVGLSALTGYLIGVIASNEVGDASALLALTSVTDGPIVTLPEVS
jgi:hypothetical protein